MGYNLCAGTFVGVRLDAAVGKNDGLVRNTRYFECEPNHGLMMKKVGPQLWSAVCLATGRNSKVLVVCAIIRTERCMLVALETQVALAAATSRQQGAMREPGHQTPGAADGGALGRSFMQQSNVIGEL